MLQRQPVHGGGHIDWVVDSARIELLRAKSYCAQRGKLDGASIICAQEQKRYRVAKMHTMPYLDRPFSAKEPYNECFFCGKRPTSGRMASGETLAPEPPRVTGVGPLVLWIMSRVCSLFWDGTSYHFEIEFHQSFSELLCVSSVIVCVVVCFINHCLSCCVFHQWLSDFMKHCPISQRTSCWDVPSAK